MCLFVCIMIVYVFVCLYNDRLFVWFMFSVFENSDKIILVMEYASGGELYDYCNDKRGLYDEEARKFFRQIISATHYLHTVSMTLTSI